MTALALAAAITLMEHDDFMLRERGSLLATELVKRSPGAAGADVSRFARSHESAEVRGRCERVGWRYRAWLAETYVPKGVPCWPAIDAVMPRNYVLEWEYRSAVGPAPAGEECMGPYWFAWRRATEVWVRDQIRSGEWTADEADRVLVKMWARELEMTETMPSIVGCIPAMRLWVWGDGYPKPRRVFGVTVRP